MRRSNDGADGKRKKSQERVPGHHSPVRTLMVDCTCPQILTTMAMQSGRRTEMMYNRRQAPPVATYIPGGGRHHYSCTSSGESEAITRWTFWQEGKPLPVTRAMTDRDLRGGREHAHHLRPRRLLAG